MAEDGPLQPSLFDQQDLAEITSEDFPGERVRAGRLHGAGPVGIGVGKVISTCKTAKHFAVTVTDDSLTIARKQDQIDAEAALVTACKNLNEPRRPFPRVLICGAAAGQPVS
jgi:hypothetical protein